MFSPYLRMLSLFLSCNLKFVFYMFCYLCFLFACGYADGWKAGGTAVAVSTISTQKTASLTHRAGKLGWDDEKWRGGWLWFALVGAVKFFFEFCFDIQRRFILFWMKTRQPHNWCLFLTTSHGQFRGHSKSAPLFKRFKHLPKVWPRSRVAISEECVQPKVAIHFLRFTRQRKAWKHGLGIAPRENSRLESETALDNFLRNDCMRQVCLDVRFEQMHKYHKI